MTPFVPLLNFTFLELHPLLHERDAVTRPQATRAWMLSVHRAFGTTHDDQAAYYSRSVQPNLWLDFGKMFLL